MATCAIYLEKLTVFDDFLIVLDRLNWVDYLAEALKGVGNSDNEDLRERNDRVPLTILTADNQVNLVVSSSQLLHNR